MSRMNAVERMHRILSILPWIMANPGCGVAEVAERFAIDEPSLREDLDIVFNRVEVYPFTPDMLIDVMIDDDRIFVGLGNYFDHPPGLNASEALTLLTAAQLAMRFSENASWITDGGLLASAIEKLSASLGVGRGNVVSIEVSGTDPLIVDTIRDAIDSMTRLRIDYYSYGRDELTQRTVDPWHLANHSGFWYLKAFCHLAGGEREFRLDRIYSVERTDERFDGVDGSTPTSREFGDSGRTVILRGPSSIDWVSRTYPIESSSVDGDVVEITLVATQNHWLERLLLRLPADVSVSDASTGADLRWVRADAARRILDRYGVT